MKRYEKPFARSHRFAETVANLDVVGCVRKKSMDQLFELRPIDVEELVFCDDFNACEQIGRIILRSRNTLSDTAAGHTNLVYQLAMLGNGGMIGFAAQNVYRPAFEIVVLRLVTK